MTAWRIMARSSASAARTVSSATLRKDRLSAAHWGGSDPIACGWTPRRSTVAGTSTPAPTGRLSMRPRFATLAWMVRWVPVTSEWMTCGAYSATSSGSPRSSSPPAARVARAASYWRTLSSLIWT